MKEVILHLGSNIPERTYYLNLALEGIKDKLGNIIVTSGLYETEAWGLKDQDDFINLAVKVKTSVTPFEVLDIVKGIEEDIGRKKKIKWGPRCIDIDVLFYEDEIINSEKLTLPHPMLVNRNFVLIPLMEIDGNFEHPVLKKTIEELYLESSDECEVWIYELKNK